MTRGVTWVSTELSGRPRSGGTIRSGRLLAAVAERMPVDAVVIGPGDPAFDAELPVRSISRFVGRAGLRARVTGLQRRYPTTAARAWDPTAAALVRQLAGLVVCDFIQTGAYRPHDSSYVLSLHNLEADVVRPPRGLDPRSLESQVEARRRLRWERRLVHESRAQVVVVSRRDANRLGRECLVVPNGTEWARHPPEARADGPIVFIGAYDYPPNVEAISWWCRRVWPLLRTRRPLHAVGRSPEQLGELRTHPGVVVVGEVADTSPVLGRASFVVVPLVSGGGTRLKVLEALGHARPVISTPKGVEGLPVGEAQGVLVAETAADLAHLVDRLGRNPHVVSALGAAGHAAAREYDWRRVAEPFADLVESLVRQR